MEEREVLTSSNESLDYRRTNAMLLVFLIFSIVCVFISILVAATCVILDVLVIIEVRGQRIHRKGYHILAVHILTFFGVIMYLVNLLNLIMFFSIESFQALLVGIYFLFGGLVCHINRWEIMRWE